MLKWLFLLKMWPLSPSQLNYSVLLRHWIMDNKLLLNIKPLDLAIPNISNISSQENNFYLNLNLDVAQFYQFFANKVNVSW